MLEITVNGRKVVFASPPTVMDVLERLEAPRAAVAVEVNRVIVPRSAHADRRLASGDEVEVVTFVGGG
jgi:sulfur carrier protein